MLLSRLVLGRGSQRLTDSPSTGRVPLYFLNRMIGGSIPSTGSNSPNEITAVADAIATYCLPSTEYTTGEAVSISPTLKCHRFFPFFALSATK